LAFNINLFQPSTFVRCAAIALPWLRRAAPFALRFGIIGYVLYGLAPAQPRLIPGPPQVVTTQHPVVCVHTRLTDEVEDWKIQRTLQLVREMGASTIVDFFPWAYIEVGEGVFDWHHPDRIIGMAHQEGLRVIARLGIVPGWARPDPRKQETSLNYLTPDRFGDYAEFVAAFAARYRGQVIGVIAWNEPNLGFEWGYQAMPPPSQYVELLRQIHAAVRPANPDMILMGGALAPTLEPVGSPNGMNEIDYLRQMYEAGAAPYFDALAVHSYGFTDSADADPAPDRLNFRRFELLLAVMRQYGDGDKPVYITESGWNDHPRWTRAVRPGLRLQYTLDSFRLAERNWPTVKNVCIWYFRAPLPVLSYPDYFAFVTTEFRVKPIYSAVQDYALGRLP
jgi:polysaccharide biosynthesis protein PslG